MDTPLNSREFNTIMARYHALLNGNNNIAVAVSGGGDSLALAHLLAHWCQVQNKTLHILTVDHKLRPESSAEAEKVKSWVRTWPNALHHTLEWNDANKPQTRIQESARKARYDLLESYCQAHNITALFLGHHLNDQFETFIIRLTSGSGLTGLCAMDEITTSATGINKIRPLLHHSHDTILDYLRENDMAWIEDPSNENDKFKRVRVRKAEPFLRNEGLSPRRVDTLITRLNRANTALEHYTHKALSNILITQNERSYSLSFSSFLSCPEEIGLRILKTIMQDLQGNHMHYPPNSEKLENLYDKIISEQEGFKGATLYKCHLSLKEKKQVLCISVE